MKTFKILGLMLTYPKDEMVSHLDELVNVLEDEKILPAKQIKAIAKLTSEMAGMDLMDLQEAYVETFDRGRSHCLHLFEHIHGESRDRGQAMVDLADMYKTKGLYIDIGTVAELPDYLPLFLEYLSLCELEEAKDLLGDTIHVVAAIGAKLKKKDNKYHVVFKALEELSQIKVDKKVIEEAVANEEDLSLEAIDKEWEEAEAFGGDPQKDDCGTCNAFPNATEALKQGVK
jgi:nitrate reductase delta subunit